MHVHKQFTYIIHIIFHDKRCMRPSYICIQVLLHVCTWYNIVYNIVLIKIHTDNVGIIYKIVNNHNH